MTSDKPIGPAIPHPHQLEVDEFQRYDVIIDARSPREFEEDHIPSALNLPVVVNDEYERVGITHKDDPHRAYLVGVRLSLRNIADHIDQHLSGFGNEARFLVYCFRGGKRSKLWADNLRTIGFKVDVLQGGWKNYRRWVRDGLESLPPRLGFKVLSGSTGTGKTRLLAALERAGEQVLDLEALAAHRGSLIGGLPGIDQPSQKYFETLLLDKLRTFDPDRVVWVEDESRKIGAIQIPEAMFSAIRRGDIYNIEAPMNERVRLWREDYPQLVSDPVRMVEMLKPVRGLVGGEEYACWETTAAKGATDELFERVMVQHYDPCYVRSMRKERTKDRMRATVRLHSLSDDALNAAARSLINGEVPDVTSDECK